MSAGSTTEAGEGDHQDIGTSKWPNWGHMYCTHMQEKLLGSEMNSYFIKSHLYLLRKTRYYANTALFPDRLSY